MRLVFTLSRLFTHDCIHSQLNSSLCQGEDEMVFELLMLLHLPSRPSKRLCGRHGVQLPIGRDQVVKG
jgi:hypothetical protein